MATTSNTESMILRRLAAVKNCDVAVAIGMDETFISRFSHGERGLRIEHIGPFLKAIGLRVIECDGDVVSMPAKRAGALAYLAAEALSK